MAIDLHFLGSKTHEGIMVAVCCLCCILVVSFIAFSFSALLWKIRRFHIWVFPKIGVLPNHSF